MIEITSTTTKTFFVYWWQRFKNFVSDNVPAIVGTILISLIVVLYAWLIYDAFASEIDPQNQIELSELKKSHPEIVIPMMEEFLDDGKISNSEFEDIEYKVGQIVKEDLYALPNND